VGDRGLDALHDSGTGFLVESRSDKKQQFVSLHQLTSFGLYGPGLVKARTGAGISFAILAKEEGWKHLYFRQPLFPTVSPHLALLARTLTSTALPISAIRPWYQRHLARIWRESS